MIQHFNSDRYGKTTFQDKRETFCSVKCQPRDIQIITGEDCRALKEEIVIDIRLGQDCSVVGIARGMKHEA